MDRERIHLLVVMTGIVLIMAAWDAVYLASVPFALAMTAVAMLLPFAAALVAPLTAMSRTPFQSWEDEPTPETDGFHVAESDHAARPEGENHEDN